jgi:hypothetical protein
MVDLHSARFMARPTKSRAQRLLYANPAEEEGAIWIVAAPADTMSHFSYQLIRHRLVRKAVPTKDSLQLCVLGLTCV